MNSAYASAAQRMQTHATHLLADIRLGTADHLFGLAAECALKAILHAHGVIPAPPDRPTDKQARAKYSVHINQLWSEYVAWASGIGALQLPATSNFDTWNASDRYHHDNFFAQSRVEGHRDGAALTAALLELAVINGVVQ